MLSKLSTLRTPASKPLSKQTKTTAGLHGAGLSFGALDSGAGLARWLSEAWHLLSRKTDSPIPIPGTPIAEGRTDSCKLLTSAGSRWHVYAHTLTNKYIEQKYSFEFCAKQQNIKGKRPKRCAEEGSGVQGCFQLSRLAWATGDQVANKGA